ncbi:hypothetical protein F4821DRAFT_260845 [Hypoxylon rubiginosum]|uniref:Uncharacterized protein n=1 Tax=Hypoxylon rubiginosum TaxID=110542 RepID=A0ACC0CYQ7_9PEZI|nr:hypothetical protein F4821DRAFT_260845 [Hypoxylon rubiginosum]
MSTPRSSETTQAIGSGGIPTYRLAYENCTKKTSSSLMYNIGCSFRVVTLSNQGGLTLHLDPKSRGPKGGSKAKVDKFEQKCNAMLAQLDLPTTMYTATARGHVGAALSGLRHPRRRGLSRGQRTARSSSRRLPGAGKGTFYWRHLKPFNYKRVNQDTLKSRAKCFKAAADFLDEGSSANGPKPKNPTTTMTS